MAREMGMSAQEISLKEGVPISSIYGIVSRYRVQKSAQSAPRSGRPPTLTDREKRVVMRLIAKDPFIKAREIISAGGLGCCERTIIRWLQLQGVQHAAVLQIALTPEVAQKRQQGGRSPPN